MFAKVLVGAMLIVAISARSIEWDGDIVYIAPYGEFELEEPENSHRVRRQARVIHNSDGSTGLDGKLRMAGNDDNVLSIVGTGSRGLGLALDNVNGHGLAVMKETVPGFGDKLTGAGQVNVFHNDNHDVSARASITRNMPDFPQAPNFNTVAGGLDYKYKNDKFGASFDIASTPYLQRKDYSAAANYNVFKTPTSSLDFNAGYHKLDTPFMRTSWEPNFGMIFRKSF